MDQDVPVTKKWLKKLISKSRKKSRAQIVMDLEVPVVILKMTRRNTNPNNRKKRKRNLEKGMPRGQEIEDQQVTSKCTNKIWR